MTNYISIYIGGDLHRKYSKGEASRENIYIHFKYNDEKQIYFKMDIEISDYIKSCFSSSLEPFEIAIYVYSKFS